MELIRIFSGVLGHAQQKNDLLPLVSDIEPSQTQIKRVRCALLEMYSAKQGTKNAVASMLAASYVHLVHTRGQATKTKTKESASVAQKAITTTRLRSPMSTRAKVIF